MFCKVEEEEEGGGGVKEEEIPSRRPPRFDHDPLPDCSTDLLIDGAL